MSIIKEELLDLIQGLAMGHGKGRTFGPEEKKGWASAKTAWAIDIMQRGFSEESIRQGFSSLHTQEYMPKLYQVIEVISEVEGRKRKKVNRHPQAQKLWDQMTDGTIIWWKVHPKSKATGEYIHSPKWFPMLVSQRGQFKVAEGRTNKGKMCTRDLDDLIKNERDNLSIIIPSKDIAEGCRPGSYDWQLVGTTWAGSYPEHVEELPDTDVGVDEFLGELQKKWTRPPPTDLTDGEASDRIREMKGDLLEDGAAAE